jgi:hypothetical protein
MTATQVKPEDVTAGKPYLWKSALFGEIAVHVKGFSPNGKVAVLTLDGGADAKQAKQFFALHDGIGFAVLARGELHTRPKRTNRAKATAAPVATNRPRPDVEQIMPVGSTPEAPATPVRKTRAAAKAAPAQEVTEF